MNGKQFALHDMSLSKVERILADGPWFAQPSWIAEGALTLVLIHLSDVLAALRAEGLEVAFSEEVPDVGITEHLRQMRNAVCHVRSGEKNFEAGDFGSFNRVTNRGSGFVINGVELRNDFDNEIAFFYGAKRVYLRRHIERATLEARAMMAKVRVARP